MPGASAAVRSAVALIYRTAQLGNDQPAESDALRFRRVLSRAEGRARETAAKPHYHRASRRYAGSKRNLGRTDGVTGGRGLPCHVFRSTGGLTTL